MYSWPEGGCAVWGRPLSQRIGRRVRQIDSPASAFGQEQCGRANGRARGESTSTRPSRKVRTGVQRVPPASVPLPSAEACEPPPPRNGIPGTPSSPPLTDCLVDADCGPKSVVARSAQPPAPRSRPVEAKMKQRRRMAARICHNGYDCRSSNLRPTMNQRGTGQGGSRGIPTADPNFNVSSRYGLFLHSCKVFLYKIVNAF